MSDNFTDAEKTFIVAELARMGHAGCTVNESGIQYVAHGRALRVDELDALNRDFALVRNRVLMARLEPGAVAMLPKDKGSDVLRWLAGHELRQVQRDTADVPPAPAHGITGYRVLSDADKALMNELKAAMNAYGAILDRMRLDPALDQRWLAIARTDAQTSCMAACRAVAQPGGFA